MPEAAKIPGLTKGQVWVQWKQYQTEGIEGLLTLRYRDRQPRLSAENLEKVKKQTETGFKNIKEARQWVEKNLSVKYSVNGLGRLFKREKLKKKTGRTRHHKQKLEDVVDFKKNTMPIGTSATGT